ncbi:hypothetical protein [Sulfidibacter corallicola]|uniref:Transposase (putative) YhgA-like domain-containing protein n=1 Tax=Sulfidibacter corallicola TaxID=2818388 RepID=A0A8A4TRF3_SULCO|nr:hypothetical protein [Sulfidibacter corallicola]QTD51977.1 hypothetical protein J3U87_05845 [Sulfidibacter corallicola]
MSRKAGFSHDGAFKDLVLSFPKQSLRALVPDLESWYGALEEVIQLRQEMPREGLYDRRRIVDLAMRLTFRSGARIVCLLEHQSRKSTFSIHRLCHYAVDLDKLMEGIPVLPVVVFTERPRWRREVRSRLGHVAADQTWLHFSYLKVRLRDKPVDAIWTSNNPVWYILAPLLDYPEEERLHVAAMAYIHLLRVTDRGTLIKFMDFIDIYAKLNQDEKRAIDRQLDQEEDGMMVREILMEKGIEIGEQRGEQRGIEIGELRGKDVGRDEKAMKVIERMYRKGYETEEIASIVEMSVAAVEAKLTRLQSRNPF